MSEQQSKDIIKQVDYQGNDKINYTEFLAVTLDVNHYLDDNKLNAMFSQFDIDVCGKISKHDIADAMVKLGHEISHEDIEMVMRVHNQAHDGSLSKEEFRALILGVTQIEYDEAKTTVSMST